MKRWKRMTAALLVSCLLASLFPVGAAAAETTLPNGGNIEQAVSQAKDGDVININGSCVVGAEGGGDQPWVIDKAVTIRGGSITLWRGGIVLNADVTFENVKLHFSNSVRNAIIANGHTLTLDSVAPAGDKAYSFNVFGGTLLPNKNGGENFEVPKAGNAGKIIIKGSTSLQGLSNVVGDGNIYAGSLSMGALNPKDNFDGEENVFPGNVEIQVENYANLSGEVIPLGQIYAGGAQQRNPYGVDGEKKTSPNEEKYKVSGTVTISGAKIPTVDGRGSDKTNVVYRGGGNQASLSFQAVSNLSVESGDLVPQAGSSFRDNTAAVGVASGAILNVKNLGNWTIGNFSGGGYLVMAANQTMTMAGIISGQTAVAIDGMNYNKTQSTGIPTAGHTYVKAASSKDGDFTLLPYATMLDMELVRDDSGNWKASGDATETINRVTSFNIVPDTAAITMAEDAEIEMEATFETEVLPLLDFVPLIISVDGGADLSPKEGDDGYYTYSYQGGVLNMTVMDDALCITPDRQYSAGTYKIQVTIPARYNATDSTLKDTVTLTVTDDSTPPDPDKPISISVPSAEQNLKYTGSEQTGVPEGTGYTINNNKATNAGNYTAQATPTSGYQWSDGTQETKKIPWSIAKADSPAAPTGLTGVAPTAAGKADGKITGTTMDMEYATKADFSDAKACTGSEITGLASGTYYVRIKGTTNVNAGAYATVEVPAATQIKTAKVPVAKTGLKWTGAEQVGVEAGTGCTLSGEFKATAVGSYTATATLAAGYQWEGGGTDAKTINWSIAKAAGPAAPTNLVGHNSGKITGTTADMEYAENENFSNAKSCAEGETTAAPGIYYVRYKATDTHEAGASAEVKVPAPGELNTVPIPAARTDLKWTGEEQTGVPEGTGYTITNHKATNAGDYTAQATPESGYQWSDGTRGTKEIPWSIAKGDGPAAPTGLKGTAPTSASRSDGKITGTTAAMEYAKNADFTNAQDCTGSEITGLASGTYYVRVKATGNQEAGAAASVTVPAYEDEDDDNNGGGGGGGGSSGGGSTQEPVTTPQQTANQIKSANAGSTVTMSLGSGNTVSRTVWQALAGKDVILEIETGRFSWAVDGRNVDPKALPTNLNLGAKEGMNLIPAAVLEQMPRGSETLQISLNHNGSFAIPLTLSVDLGRDNAQRWANLYYYNTQTKAMDFQSSALISDRGRASFPMDHASSYAVVVDRVSHGPEGADAPFQDVNLGAWYYDVVRYVYQKGIMTGTGRDTFSPLSLTTRGQAVATLYRMAGSPTPGGAVSFRDVAPGSYYEDAVRWAVASGVASGHSAETFAPDAPITREQLAALLHRYARIVEGENGTASAQALSRFPDQGKVSAYAVQPLSWAVERGLIDGFQDGSLQPQGQANRAQMAAVLSRFAER